MLKHLEILKSETTRKYKVKIKTTIHSFGNLGKSKNPGS
jgi:hypothetical protein